MVSRLFRTVICVWDSEKKKLSKERTFESACRVMTCVAALKSVRLVFWFFKRQRTLFWRFHYSCSRRFEESSTARVFTQIIYLWMGIGLCKSEWKIPTDSGRLRRSCRFPLCIFRLDFVLHSTGWNIASHIRPRSLTESHVSRCPFCSTPSSQKWQRYMTYTSKTTQKFTLLFISNSISSGYLKMSWF